MGLAITQRRQDPQNFGGLGADSFFNHQDDLGGSFHSNNNPNHQWTPINVAPHLTMKTLRRKDAGESSYLGDPWQRH
jgi:hypothetical protein